VGRLLGIVASITAPVDVSDRAARLLGVIASITAALPAGANLIGSTTAFGSAAAALLQNALNQAVVDNRGVANVATGQVTMTAATATVIAAARVTRQRAIVRNLDATNSIYLGFSAAVTAANGFLVKAGESIEVATATAIYGFQAAATPAVAYWEEYS